MMTAGHQRWLLPFDALPAWRRLFFRRALLAVALPATALLVGLGIRYPPAVAVLFVVASLYLGPSVRRGFLHYGAAAKTWLVRRRESEAQIFTLLRMVGSGSATARLLAAQAQAIARMDEVAEETRQLHATVAATVAAFLRTNVATAWAADAPSVELLHLAMRMSREGNIEGADLLLGLSRQDARARGDKHLLARLDYEHARLLRASGRPAEGQEKLLEAYQVAHLLEDRQLESSISFELGVVAEAQAHRDEAERWFRIAIAKGEAAERLDVVGLSAFRLGLLAAEGHRVDDARSFLRRAMDLAADHNDATLAAATALQLAQLPDKGDEAEIMAIYQRALIAIATGRVRRSGD